MIRSREYLEAVKNIKLDVMKEIRRSTKKMTQRELCELTGLHQSEVSELLSGNNPARFSVDRLLMVLLALGHKPVIHMGYMPCTFSPIVIRQNALNRKPNLKGQ